MRFRCRSPRNRKSARLARISARPQHSVYPAVSQNDNHRHSEHEGHRVQRRVATRRATPCVGVIPRKMARYPVHRSTAIHYRRPRLEYRVTRRRGRRRPVTAGPPARLMHKKPPAPKPRAIRTITLGDFRKSERRASSARARERGRRRTRQDQISRGGFGPR
jgi:hypothetical protein